MSSLGDISLVSQPASLSLVDQPASPPVLGRYIVEIVTPSAPEKPTELKADASNSTTSKMQYVAYALFALGALLLLASIGMFGAGLFVGAATLSLAETLYPFGILALIAGTHLAQEPESSVSPKVSPTLKFPGGVSLPIGIKL